jgi:DNA-binding NtrC family response regulator
LVLQGSPVPTPPTILLYGHDELLLMTRSRILVGAGFRACMTCEVRQIPQLVRELQADLVVLCHSLSCTDRVVAAMVAKNHRAEVRTLLMMADGSMGECDSEFSEVADEMFNLSLEPEKLVEKVRSMLKDRLQSGLRISPWKGLSRLAPTN